MSAQDRLGSTRTAPPEPSVALSAPNTLREPLARQVVNDLGFTQDEIDSGLARVVLALTDDVERLPLDRLIRGLAS